MKNYQHSAFQKYNPFRPPDWRHRRVIDLLDKRNENNNRLSWRKDDANVKEYRKFVRGFKRYSEDEHGALFASNPGLYYANMIRDNEASDLRYIIEARLLAGQTDEEIAKRVCTLPSAVNWYETLFFNVRDRLDNKDWVVNIVIGPTIIENGLEDRVFDATAKLFGYFAGPVVLDSILDGFTSGEKVTEPSEVDKFFDKRLTSGLKRRSALAVGSFEVNKYNVMNVFEMHARLIELEKQYADTGGEKTDYEKNVTKVLQSLKWGVGTAGRDNLKGSPLLEYDDKAIEIRADDAIRMAQTKVNDLQDNADRVLPPPRKKRAGA